jgi:hypothetical protein
MRDASAVLTFASGDLLENCANALHVRGRETGVAYSANPRRHSGDRPIFARK